MQAGGRQVVIFEVASEWYGLDVSAVREISTLGHITPVPGSSELVEGVIDLRGQVIPVLDLRKRFGFAPAEESLARRVVVTEFGEHRLALVVDGVSRVHWINDTDIEPPSPVVCRQGLNFIEGLARLEGHLAILIRLSDMLTADERASLSHISQSVA
ncbi:MAG: chemotaxis protein CheW [Bacillota bacterium]